MKLGRAAYGRRAWDDAYRSLSLADEAGGLGASDLELLAWSAALTHRDQVFPKVLERIYLAYVDANEHTAMSLSLLKFVGQASLVDDAMLPS